MKILCNLPLECFAERARLAPFEIVTYGPPDRMRVDGVHYPFDLAFDPAEGSIRDLLRLLPAGFAPDLLLLYWPDQEPLPADLEQCPFPVAAVVSDWNLSLPWISGLAPFFDVLLVDRAGVDVFRGVGYDDVRAWCQFTFKAPSHRIVPGIARDIDVGFAGNLNPVVQRGRAPWIDRLRALAARGPRVEIVEGVFGEAYGRFLNRCRIGFNRSIRGEMNLRAFEVPACGALLFMERGNLEVREFFEPGKEAVLYGDDDLEELIERYLADEPERARIARAGHARVQSHGLAGRLHALAETLRTPGPGRPTSTSLERLLGRGTALLCTWSRGNAAIRDLVAAARLAPDDPRVCNALALALLRRAGGARAQEAAALLRRAALRRPDFLPASWNLAVLTGQQRTPIADVLARARAARDLDGPVLPLGYSADAIAWAGALARAAEAHCQIRLEVLPK